MANVTKINGYDVKDAVARGNVADIQQGLSTAQGDISTLQNDVSDTKADLGEITALDTTVKTSAVNAINEVNGKADDNANAIGTLSDLSTTDKTDIVMAVNEVKAETDDNASAVGNIADLSTTAKEDLVSAINEVDSHTDMNTANFAPTFSNTTSYEIGEYVIYNNTLYRCSTAHSAGVWVDGHFSQVTVGGMLGDIVPNDASRSNKLVTQNSFYYKSGTVNFNCDANSWKTVAVTFDSAMPDSNYIVTLESGGAAYVHVQNVTNKSADGFIIIIWNRDEIKNNSGIINWQAFKIN